LSTHHHVDYVKKFVRNCPEFNIKASNYCDVELTVLSCAFVAYLHYECADKYVGFINGVYSDE